MTSTGSYTQFRGSLQSIPSDADPALQLLAAYLPAVDALDRSSPKAVEFENLISPSMTFITNGSPPVAYSQVTAMFEQRAKGLEEFTHAESDVNVFSFASDGGMWTVVCECASVSVFKRDPKKDRLKVHELLIFKMAPAQKGKGLCGLWIDEAKTFMDPQAILSKAKEISEEEQ